MLTTFKKAAVLATAIVALGANISAVNAQGYSGGMGQGYGQSDGPGAGGGYARPGGQGYQPGYGQGYQPRYQGGNQGGNYRQAAAPAAQWMCQYGVRETNPNIKLPAVFIQFQLTALRDGRAFGRGVFNEQSPIQFFGQWSARQGQFQFSGQTRMFTGVRPFQMIARIGQDGSLHYNWTSPTGKVLVIACQRQA